MATRNPPIRELQTQVNVEPSYNQGRRAGDDVSSELKELRTTINTLNLNITQLNSKMEQADRTAVEVSMRMKDMDASTNARIKEVEVNANSAMQDIRATAKEHAKDTDIRIESIDKHLTILEKTFASTKSWCLGAAACASILIPCVQVLVSSQFTASKDQLQSLVTVVAGIEKELASVEARVGLDGTAVSVLPTAPRRH